jgi:hypothetical protein
MLYVSLLVEALRAHPETMFWIAALSQALLWTLVPTLFYSAPPGDVSLVIAVGHEWLLGSPFGPPLAYWLAEIALRLTGNHIVGVYLLSQICVVVTFWAVFALGCCIVGARHALMAVLLMVGVSAFSVPTPEFGPGLLAMPLSALAIFHFWKALGEDQRNYWYALAFDLGLLVLTTYAGLILVALIAAFAASTPRGRVALGTIEPWISGLVVAVILIPHLFWLDRAGGAPVPVPTDFFLGLIKADGHLTTWLLLIASILAVHGALLVMVVVAGGVNVGPRASAPLFVRPPVDPFARNFVYFFTLTPGFLASVVAVLLERRAPIGGIAPAVVLSGLAVIVAAGHEIHLHRQRIVGVTWLALLAAPALLTVAATGALPWTVALDLETGQPAKAMAQFFTESFRRRTGKPLEIIGGDQRIAQLVAMTSPDRPSVYFNALPEMSPWVSEADMRTKGAILVWQATDTAGTPPALIKARFPDLVPEVPRSFERTVQGRLPLLRIGWGLIRPPSASDVSAPQSTPAAPSAPQ